MTFQLEADVPVPARAAPNRDAKYPFNQMEVGQSFLVPLTGEDNDVNRIRRRMNSACGTAQRRIRKTTGNEVRFTSRTVTEGVRVWRTK